LVRELDYGTVKVPESRGNELTRREALAQFYGENKISEVLPFTWQDVVAEVGKGPTIESGKDKGLDFVLYDSRLKVVRQFYGVEVFFPATKEGLTTGSAFLTSKLFTPSEQKAIQGMLEQRSLELEPRYSDLKRFRVAISRATMPDSWIRLVFTPPSWDVKKQVEKLEAPLKYETMDQHSRYGKLNSDVRSAMSSSVEHEKVRSDVQVMNILADDTGMTSVKLREFWVQSLSDNRKKRLGASVTLQAFTGSLAFTTALLTNEFKSWNKPQPVPSDLPIIELPSTTNTIGMKFNKISAGTFMMGSPGSEADRRDNEHQHPVTISKPFYMQTTEVTQGQWKALMGTEPWKGQEFSTYVKEGANYPAVYVSWDDAVAYCKKLSEKESKTYRLPTEAEWEYACRAGSKTTWSFGNDEKELGDYDWYDKNAVDIVSEQYAHQVGLKKPNAFGLYDMHGNVFEWCHDYYGGDYYQQSPTNDPMGPVTGSTRVLRGGSWARYALGSRSARRNRGVADNRNVGGGFRLVRELD
jgi:sulfatase modifying factor 1